jgi:hypothetical protein
MEIDIYQRQRELEHLAFQLSAEIDPQGRGGLQNHVNANISRSSQSREKLGESALPPEGSKDLTGHGKASLSCGSYFNEIDSGSDSDSSDEDFALAYLRSGGSVGMGTGVSNCDIWSSSPSASGMHQDTKQSSSYHNDYPSKKSQKKNECNDEGTGSGDSSIGSNAVKRCTFDTRSIGHKPLQLGASSYASLWKASTQKGGSTKLSSENKASRQSIARKKK